MRFYIEDYFVDVVFKLHNDKKRNKWVNIVELHCNDFIKSYDVSNKVYDSLFNGNKKHPLIKEFIKELKLK